MIALCIGSLMLATDHFTLSWSHSVERTAWEEVYVVEENHLLLVEAAIRGSGAGMEPPEGAALTEGWWVWQPNLVIPSITLANSGFGGAYRLCSALGCRTLPEGTVTLSPCS